VCALCVAALLALAGAPAWAAGSKSLGGSALGNLTEGSSETTASTPTTATTATTASTATTESEPHNSRSIILIVAGAAVLLLSGVAIVIVRDARKFAPASEAEFGEGSTPRHTEAALRKRRAKAKAARMQRKRNR
jgi:hypothetical protein